MRIRRGLRSHVEAIGAEAIRAARPDAEKEPPLRGPATSVRDRPPAPRSIAQGLAAITQRLIHLASSIPRPVAAVVMGTVVLGGIIGCNPAHGSEHQNAPAGYELPTAPRAADPAKAAAPIAAQTHLIARAIEEAPLPAAITETAGVSLSVLSNEPIDAALISSSEIASAPKQAWFSTDWFLAGQNGNGRASLNLWAVGGPLHKLDALAASKGAPTHARAFELRAPSFFEYGQKWVPSMSGGAFLRPDLTEKDFIESVGPSFLQSAFGVAPDLSIDLTPAVTGFDFVAADGTWVQRKAGDRVVAVLDRVPLSFSTEVRGKQVEVTLLKDGRALTPSEAGHTYFAVQRATGELMGDGQINFKADIGWWGNCHDAALASLLFEAPRHAVEKNGITFTPRDITAFLTLVAAEQTNFEKMRMVGSRYTKYLDLVVLKNGKRLLGEIVSPTAPFESLSRGEPLKLGEDFRTASPWSGQDLVLELPGGRQMTVGGAQIQSATAQFPEDIAPNVLRDQAIAMVRAGGGVADIDGGEVVLNRPFSTVRSTILTGPPAGHLATPRFSKLDPKLKVEWGELEIGYADHPRTHRYWVAYDGARVVDYEYLRTGDPPPDFLWAPGERQARWPATLIRNPELNVALIREIYEESLR